MAPTLRLRDGAQEPPVGNAGSNTNTPTAPKQPVRAPSPQEIELGLLEIALEAAYHKREQDMKAAKTVKDRRRIRQEEMIAVGKAGLHLTSDEAFRVLNGRMMILEFDQDMAGIEDRFWVLEQN